MISLREVVFGNLDNAWENGYFKEGEQLHGATAEDIAFDMLAYAEDLEDEDTIDDILPFIQEWLKTKQL